MSGIQYLERHGSACTINRTPPVNAVVSMKQSNRFGDEWEGWINPAVVPGDVFTLGSDKYLIYFARVDPTIGVSTFTAFRCNATIDSLNFSTVTDEFGVVTIVIAPKTLNVDCYGQIVTAKLVQTDPGLLATTVRTYLLPASTALQATGRLIHRCTAQEAADMGLPYDPVYLGARYRVDIIDPTLQPGIKKIQVSIDNRGV